MRAPVPLAPGRIASIYGLALGPEQPCHGSPDPARRESPSPLRPRQTAIETQVFPARLCDTEVQVGGVAAGLSYVSAGQTNFKVPQTIPIDGTTTIRVLHKKVAGPLVSLPLTAESPAQDPEATAALMWTSLQNVKWGMKYRSDPDQCVPVPAVQARRSELSGHVY
jgi:uncharacterized protein (TIGR03437 family)